MPVPSSPSILFQGLSGFWQRFFADADQVQALCQGEELLMGQAFLDLASATLAPCLTDAVAFDKEFYTLVTISEDEVSFQEGSTTQLNRWLVTSPSNPDGSQFVSIPSLDNTTFEPTASLEPSIDFDVVLPNLQFVTDPTDTSGNGTPLPGFAYRTVDIETGGELTDSTVSSWTPASPSGVMKGDIIRFLDVGPNGFQRKNADCDIVLVRTGGLWVSLETPIPANLTGAVNYVVLRTPADNQVNGEIFNLTIGNQGNLAHTRIDQGSLQIFAQAPSGGLVQENIDYVVNYESGTITAITAWQGYPGPYSANYTWKQEQFPASGASPRLSTTGSIEEPPGTTTPSLQMSFWVPDGLVDRMTLSNNFGSMIGRQGPSSEAYRGFLRGIFQLYILGPVFDRVESALNVVMGFPVVQNDGEVYQSVDFSDPNYVRVLTTNPITGLTNYYTYPAGTPLRTDLIVGAVLSAFEVLTTAVTVTDYVQSPTWWASSVIPIQLFTPIDGQYPDIIRRTSSPLYVLNVVDPVDQAQVGDPGLIVGASDDGFIPETSNIYRHRVAYVLFNEYLKYQTFFVTFNAAAISALIGTAFPQSITDLNDLVVGSRPAYTYPLTVPSTFFSDLVDIIDDPISFARLVGSRVYGPDQVVFTDYSPTVGEGLWNAGDFYHLEEFTPSVSFPSLSVPVTLPDVPSSPRYAYLNRVWIEGTIGGLALRENVDYTVNHTSRTITRLTAWDSTTVTVNFMQANIGNLSTSSISGNDMPLLVGGVDPMLLAASYGSVQGWDGTTFPSTQPRDISLIERPINVYAH
jgi:hypothetical protein